jgi:hypothetical protein
MKSAVTMLFLTSLLALGRSAAAQDSQLFRSKATSPCMDHYGLDTKRDILMVSALGNNSLELISN